MFAQPHTNSSQVVPEMGEVHEETFPVTNPSPMGNKGFDFFMNPSPCNFNSKFDLDYQNVAGGPSGLLTPNTTYLLSMLQPTPIAQGGVQPSPFVFQGHSTGSASIPTSSTGTAVVVAHPSGLKNSNVMLGQASSIVLPVATAAVTAVTGTMASSISKTNTATATHANNTPTSTTNTSASKVVFKLPKTIKSEPISMEDTDDSRLDDEEEEEEEQHEEEEEEEEEEGEEMSDSEAASSPQHRKSSSKQKQQQQQQNKRRKRKASQPLATTARSFEDLTDDQIAFMDFKELMRLMVAAGLSRQEIADTKARRRRLKNRQSARLCSNKKRELCNELSSKNSVLHDTIDRLQKEVERLKKENALLKQGR